MLGPMGRTGVERARKGGERGDAHRPGAHHFGRLVDDGAAVDDVDDAPRQGRALEPCQQREQHAGGLAEPRGDVDRVRNRPARERGVEAALPRVGVVTDDGAEVGNVAKLVVAFAIAICVHGVLLARRDVGKAARGCGKCGADRGRGTTPALRTLGALGAGRAQSESGAAFTEPGPNHGAEPESAPAGQRPDSDAIDSSWRRTRARRPRLRCVAPIPESA